MKKISALILAALLCFALFAGCGNNAPAATAPMREDTPVLNPAAADIVAAFNDKQNNLLKVKKVL